MNDAAKCAICASPTHVVQTWLNAVGMRCRRRECRNCGFRHTTIERVVSVPVEIPDTQGKKQIST